MSPPTTPASTSPIQPATEQLVHTLDRVVAFLPLFLLALLVFLVFGYVAHLSGRWDAPYRRLSKNRFVRDLLRQVTRTAVLVVGALFALEIMNATTVAGAVLGTAGVLGLAVGFAFKDLIENYVAGVMMSLRQPFDPNDHVAIEGFEGKVIRLTSRATILMTLDGNHLRIPNATVLKGIMVNYTRNPRRRFELAMGLGPGEDLARALAVGIEALRATAGVLEDPPAWAQIDELGDSSVTLRYYGWIDQRVSSFATVRSEAIRRVKSALEDEGMDLPEPTYRLRMEGAAAAGAAAESEPPGPVAAPSPRAAPPTPRGEPSSGDAIDRQIAEERATTPQDDLLRRDAPRE